MKRINFLTANHTWYNVGLTLTPRGVVTQFGNYDEIAVATDVTLNCDRGTGIFLINKR